MWAKCLCQLTYISECRNMVTSWCDFKQNVGANEETLVVNNDFIVHQINLFLIVEPSSVCQIIPQLTNLHKVLSMNPMQPGKFWIPLAKITFYSIVVHWISSTITSLMHNEMNSTSLQIKVLDQFHMNASCMVTLSCLKYNMKFRRCCSNVNLHGWSHMVDDSWHHKHNQLFEVN